MNVLSFRSTPQTIPFYKKHQRDGTLVWKRLGGFQRVRGYVKRTVSPEPGIHIVYMSVEEMDGGFDGQRLPPGFQYGPMPTVTIGDPRNRRVEFVATDDQVKYYPVGKRMRVDVTDEGKIEGIVVKTQRMKNKPHWNVTVECPPEEIRFDHYAIRKDDTVHLNYESTPGADEFKQFYGRDTYIKPQLKSIRFRVPARYVDGFRALYMGNRKVVLRLEDNSLDVSGYVNWFNPEERQVEVQVCAYEQARPSAHEGKSKMLLEHMSKSLAIPYHILTADPPYGKSVLHDAYATIHECDEYMERTLAQKRLTDWVAPQVGYANGILRRGMMEFAFNLKETDDMKIYEAVIVKVDDKGTPTEIAKVVPPFLAKDDAAAKTAVTVDYATENKIAGKDLTGIQVHVRTFQVASY